MRIGLRELIFFAVLLAVPVASFVYVFMPRSQEIQKAKREVEVKQQRLDDLALVANKIDDLGLAIERGRESIELIEAKLPSEQDVEGILEQVWRIAENNGQSVRSVKSQKRKAESKYMELPLKTVMEGEFDGFYEFMLELENLPRITRIHEMKLRRLSGPGRSTDSNIAPGSMRSEFTLSIYYEDSANSGR